MTLWLLIGGLYGLIAVAAGAWGWHALETEESRRQVFMMGAQYQMWHALALLAVGWLAERRHSSVPVWVAGGSFTIGTILFSGALYSSGLGGDFLFSGAAPIGGSILMAGWAALIVEAVRGFMSRS